MEKKFKKVAIVARRHDRTINDTVTTVAEILQTLGAEIIFEDQTAAALGRTSSMASLPRSELAEQSDLVVVVGGDGSLLGVSREMSYSGVPIVGVNRGGLGFLAAVSPERLTEQFSAIWAGDYSLEDHFLLRTDLIRDGQAEHTSRALNDVVVHSGRMSRMIEFELLVNGEFVYDQRSDGVIVASPTGSTAYSLSAGGPIMHPGLDAIVIVPMFPHTLTSRPLVIRGDSSITIRVLKSKEQPQLSCDSQVNISLQQGDEIAIRKSSRPLKLLYPSGHSFFESCRSKLDWASRLGGLASHQGRSDG